MMPTDYHKEIRNNMEGCTIIRKKCSKCKKYKSPAGGKVNRGTNRFICKECVDARQARLAVPK